MGEERATAVEILEARQKGASVRNCSWSPTLTDAKLTNAVRCSSYNGNIALESLIPNADPDIVSMNLQKADNKDGDSETYLVCRAIHCLGCQW